MSQYTLESFDGSDDLWIEGPEEEALEDQGERWIDDLWLEAEK